MRFSRALWFVDRFVDVIVLTVELRIILGPHFVNDLDCFAELRHSHRRLDPFVAVSFPFDLVPTGAEACIEPTVAGDIDRRRDLGEEGWTAITVAGHHLPDV